MKKLLLTCALLACVAAKMQAQPDLIARIHFLGAEQISADTNAFAFTNIFYSTEARALESQTLDKLSRVPYELFESKIPAGAGDGTAQLRPLLDDLLKSEWIFEMRAANNGSPEYALAIRLNPERAQLWNKSLATVLQSWTGIGISQDRPGTWWLKKHQPPNLFQFSRNGDWVVIDCGQDKLSLIDQILEFPVVKNLEEVSWFSADLNWPRLEQLFPALAKFDFPKTEMQVVGRDGNLRLSGKFTLAQPLPLLEKWQVPTNTIHSPFVSFTAARGFAPWLEEQGWAQPFEIQPTPDQLFIWSLPGIPFQTFIAEPVSNASTALAQLDTKLSPLFDTNAQSRYITPITLDMTNGQFSFVGMPFIVPFVQALSEPAGDFLFAGFFPNTPRSQPLPKELFARLDMPNLVFYHWEITSQRLPQVLNLSQLSLMLTLHKQLEDQSVAEKWLTHIAPTLGYAVTEITQTAPKELTFSRKAPAGLTAFELIALSDWLEATNFPGCDLRLPPMHRHARPRPLPAQPPGAPMP